MEGSSLPMGRGGGLRMALDLAAGGWPHVELVFKTAGTGNITQEMHGALKSIPVGGRNGD